MVTLAAPAAPAGPAPKLTPARGERQRPAVARAMVFPFQVVDPMLLSMEWFPVVFLTLKVLILGVGMFFAIKWHYDKGKKARAAAGKGTQEGHTPDSRG